MFNVHKGSIPLVDLMNSSANQDELLEKILNSFKLSNEFINNIGLHSRNHVINNFSKSKMTNEYLDFYKNTVL